MINLSFDDNKIKFETNVLSLFRQEDFRRDNYKNKISQKEIQEKNEDLKEKSLQNFL